MDKKYPQSFIHNSAILYVMIYTWVLQLTKYLILKPK